MPPSSFKIGKLLIAGNVILAPMVGISDYPYRTITKKFNNAISWTSFVNAKEVVSGHPHRLRDRLWFAADEKPIIFQLYGEDCEMMKEAAMQLLPYQMDILDINLGCSVKKISARGAGSGLLRDFVKLKDLIKRLSSDYPLPLTTKIRLGWDDQQKNYAELATLLAESGSQLLTVHGRTRAQGFKDQADWQAIKEIKQTADIPVVGNGDVKNANDIERMFQITNCDAVMIGRAAIGNPWIFSRKDPKDIAWKLKIDTILEHTELMRSFYGNERSLILFRKHLAGYMRNLDCDHSSSVSLLQSNTWNEVITKLQALNPTTE